MNNKTFIAIFVFLTLPFTAYLQVVTGTLIQHKNYAIKLYGYEGFNKTLLDSTTVNEKGDFELNFSSYKGMGFISVNQVNHFIILNEKEIKIKGNNLTEKNAIEYQASTENKTFYRYAVEHIKRENAMKGLKYALNYYNDTSVFPLQSKINIEQEIKRIEKEDSHFLTQINKPSYVSWFLPVRKLLEEMPLAIQFQTGKIAENITAFRKLNFNDKRLYHSGLLGSLIEGHYRLLENLDNPLDSTYQEMNISTDYILSSLEGNDKKLNEVTTYLFNFLEKRSLFNASEYLALKMLTQNSCTLNDDLAKQLETYRTMRVGNVAPDIIFEGRKVLHQIEIPSALKLSTMNNKYTLIVFGASWCPKCKEEIPTLIANYSNWKQKGVEVVFISLDTKPQEFIEFIKDFPWLSVCDFKSWDSQAVQDYYVFSTPTMFLLDNNLKILLRPNSAKQIDAWVNYKLN